MSRKSWLILPLCLPLLGLAALARPPADPDLVVRYLRIGVVETGERGFDMGASLAAMLSRPPGMPACADDRACGVPGMVALAQAQARSADIVADVATGRLETGLVPADRVYAARCQSANPDNITILGEMYDEALHVLVRTDARVDSIAGLKGKRVAIGPAGSPARLLADRTLSAHGLRRQDIRGVELAGEEALAALADGKLDALFRIAAVPDAALADLTARTDAPPLRLLPVAGDAVGRLSGLHPFGSVGHIDDGAYPGIKGVDTLMQPVVWIAGPAVDKDLARALGRALTSTPNRTVLQKGGRDVPLLRPVALRMSAPLHPGLDGFYRVDPITMACPRGGPR
ncbi:TAXI family TRAP transporter solute-binding subunit [Niveispirillum sp. SYP-B3756]|uniref:TAXI family TRAP transporter solute-binding subunit n=1 Tax=Niveispirillum sp. SYP-B3756 TaxID=2662178 RepID=UPI001564F171|nr:TAXI family TRAP transporter solute-binding subunit [Niveispirillum sp. SYP-B3756]